MNWIDALRVLGPAVLMVVPGAQPFIPLIIAGIEVAERSNQKGADKKEIAKDAVRVGAATANQIAKKEVVNVAEAEKAAEDAIDAVVGVTNIVAGAKNKKGE
jgi:CHASE3 domain sensor protein